MKRITKAVLIAAITVCESPFADAARCDRIAKAGGELIRQGTFTGKVSVVNQQSRLPSSDCEAIARMLADLTQCNITVDTGNSAMIELYLIDDPKAPILLLAPEDHWGKLNMGRIVDDLPSDKAKAKFFVPRARKMILKALSLLMGGGSSQFPGNVMNAATMRDLDHAEENVPIDMIDFYVTYLKTLGIKPAEKTTYRKACKEGWAPAPPNEFQRAIWNKVHKIPDRPLTIEYDPQKDR